MKSIKKILEENGFTVERSYSGGYYISQYTPAGEDWGIELDKLEDFPEYAENFDPEEEFEMWIEAKHSGVRGVPSPAILWEDQKWKENLLDEVLQQINRRK